MNIELIALNDGGVILAADQPLPHVVKRVEYYNEQSMMMVVYRGEDTEDDLLNYEVPEPMIDSVIKSPNIIIYSMFPAVSYTHLTLPTTSRV